jgi:uncharacterized LabA/DUF88 family protein
MMHKPPEFTLVDNRVAIFIDGQNYFNAIRHRGLKIDLNKLAYALAAPYGRLVYKLYVTGVLPATDGFVKGRRFLDALRYQGWLVKEYVLRERGWGWTEKGVDVCIATKLVKGAMGNLYDVAILLSGDQDFVPALEEVRQEGKRVVVAQFQDFVSCELAAAADEVVLLDSLILGALLYENAA